jgi:hypothetical protein
MVQRATEWPLFVLKLFTFIGGVLLDLLSLAFFSSAHSSQRRLMDVQVYINSPVYNPVPSCISVRP